MGMPTDAIKPGGIRYETELGPLFLDQLLGDETIHQFVKEMRRRSLEPNDIVWATNRNGVIDFGLREPLSSD